MAQQRYRKMSLKTRVEGRIIEAGWEPNTSNTERVYVLVKVKLSSLRRQDLAEEQLKNLQKTLIGKKVVIFPEN